MGNGRFDALFIDFYGTLVTGDRQAVERACRRVVDDHGLPLNAAELAESWGRAFFAAIEGCNHDGFRNLYECECDTLVATVEPLVGRIDPRPYAGLLKAYWSDPPLAPLAREALAGLNVPICVVSNADTEDVQQAIRLRGLRVDHVVTSEDTRSYKPDRVIFERALDDMGVAPQRVLHAGDSLHSDVGGAGALGIVTCWVRYAERILDVGTAAADHTICNLMQLRELV